MPSFAVRREVAFIDPSVADVDALLAGLRPGVMPILLSGRRDAVEEMAEALSGFAGLDAVHVLAHGRPGEVSFKAGALAADALARHAEALRAIGDSLSREGALLLWSCETGKGARGEAFVAALARALGAEVRAAEGLIGAPARGGARGGRTDRRARARRALGSRCRDIQCGTGAAHGRGNPDL